MNFFDYLDTLYISSFLAIEGNSIPLYLTNDTVQISFDKFHALS